MKNLIYLLMVLPSFCLAQKEGNFWLFGHCNSIHFNGGSPVYGGVPGTGDNTNWNISFNRSNAVADGNGVLQFFVKLAEYDSRLPHNASIYDARDNPMPNSELATASPVRGVVHIARNPAKDYLYYVIYSLNYGLLYTTVDMRLRNGLGGVVAAEKGVMLSGWQTVVAEKTAIVPGCDGLWLVVRSRMANEYWSYRITAAGIDPHAVVSECGLLPLGAYKDSWYGFQPGDDNYGGMTREHQVGWAGSLRASPDGLKMVAACSGGLELYRFSRCSGRLSAPLLIDTTTKTAVHYTAICGFPTLYPKVTFNATCFSPDNTKLYATYYLMPYVFQYDLSVPREAIMATKTKVLTNQPTRSLCGPGCDFIDTIGIDDLKLGPDGKVYIPNNGQPPCRNTTISNVGHMADYALHVINDPNLPGMACNPQHNALVLGPLNDSGSRFRTYHTFSPGMVLAPQSAPDTFSSTSWVSLCAGDVLQADTAGDCYRWSTGMVDTAAISVWKGGLYTVEYYKNCSYYWDSFWVAMAPFPDVAPLQYGCPGALSILASQKAGDSTGYRYYLQHPNGDSSIAYSASGYVFRNLDTGVYELRVQTAQGCDTLFPVVVVAYPAPVLETEPGDTIIRYGDTLQLYARGAIDYVWSPTRALSDALIADPQAWPRQNTRYQVIGRNGYGCRDTGYVWLRLDYNLPDMMPNAFSPNGDGLNDVLLPAGITYQQIRFFKVFNRLGQMVFYSNESHQGWNGTFKGKPCDLGTYYYQLELEYPNGVIKRLKGDVVLLR